MADEGKEPTQTMRPLPQVDKVLRHPILEEEAKRVRRDMLAELTRRELERLRKAHGKSGGASGADIDTIALAVVARARELMRGGVRRVLNGTGVILNTNLGRAPVAMPIVERLSGLLPGYCSLEIDLKTGKRGERTKVLEELLSLLTGCEAAIVVNNNAGAVMLAVSALSYGKEVIVSRGELIEIGGSFRLPDVIVSAGGVLKEVGTTNRTRADDYRKAVTPNTGILLRCHRSNFAITGFTEEAAMGDLVKLSKETGVPLLEDLGSGAIFDLSSLGLKAEPTVGSVIQAGVDLVLFSGDKLLGGVQAGIVAGKRELVERLRKHPIYRALRADKLIITILEGVLSQYLSPEPQTTVPLLAMASCPSESLRQRAENLCSRLLARVKVLRTQICPASSAFGGGTLPDQTIPSFGLEIHAPVSCEKLVEKLRAAEPPVVPIVSDGKVILDLRTILPEEEPLLMAALEQVDQELQSK